MLVRRFKRFLPKPRQFCCFAVRVHVPELPNKLLSLLNFLIHSQHFTQIQFNYNSFALTIFVASPSVTKTTSTI
ncbi:hypothetical protein Hdeb2414_s0026g00682081 [Helianthus debilis subsp. tardiflorus]